MTSATVADADWNNEPFVTGLQFMELPAHQRDWFLGQPNVWRPLDVRLDVLHNCAHPDNRELVAQDLIREARANG